MPKRIQTSITKSDDLRLYNRSRVLSCLRNNHNQSRKCISELTGLSSATVTQVTAGLLSDGVIEEITPEDHTSSSNRANNSRGRPQVILGLKSDAATVAVVMLVLNQLQVVLFNYAGKQLFNDILTMATSELTTTSLSTTLSQHLNRALPKKSRLREKLKHIAVVVQGTVSSDARKLLWSPITRVKHFEIASVIEIEFQAPVSVVNDTKMMASAVHHEHSFSKGDAAADNFGAMLLSYGIGLGLYHRGTMLTGSFSSGSEFGHMLLYPDGALCRCGRKGCIEAYASDYAIWRRAMQEPLDTPPVDEINPDAFESLVEKANSKAGPERTAFEEAGAAIGLGLNNLYALFDQFPVAMVGTNPAAFSLMEEALYKNLRHTGTPDDKALISVYENKSLNTLILKGAHMLTLSYVDREVFGLGEIFLSVD